MEVSEYRTQLQVIREELSNLKDRIDYANYGSGAKFSVDAAAATVQLQAADKLLELVDISLAYADDKE